jgi:cation:H+ antiporter
MIEFIVQVVILAASLIVLALGGHFSIRAIEKLIELTGLSEVSAGFVILAVMTSTPEISVAVFSVLQGTPGISIGDILGSNVFNVGVVMGILAMLGYMKTCCTELMVELTDILFLTALIPLLLIIAPLRIFVVSSPIVGVILLGAFVVNAYFILRKRTPSVELEGNETVTSTARRGSVVRAVIILCLGFAGLLVAARLVVNSSSSIAVFLGAPQILIGAKIVAIGTSLPELTLDLTAVRRGRVQLALGDIIGSNLTNLTLVLGLVLVSSPFAVDMTVFAEILPFVLITTVVLWRFLTKGGVSQFGGMVLVLIYVLFQAVLV